MSSKQLHLVLVALIILLLAGLGGGTYLLNSALGKKGDALTKLKAEALALEKEKTDLKTAKKQIATYADLEIITQTIVPEDKNQAEAVREIVEIAGHSYNPRNAKATDINLTSVAFPESTLGTIGVKPGAPAAAAPASAAASSNSKANSLSQLTQVKTIPGVYQLPITVQGDSSYENFILFLQGLESNRRTSQVSNLNIAPDTQKADLVHFTLTVNEYIKP